MQREQWREVSALLDVALDLPQSDRDDWLEALKAHRPDLGATVGRLLAQANGPALTDAVARFDAVVLDALAASGPESGAERPTPIEAGRPLGAWTLVRKIGEGGMGQVWLARRSDRLYEAVAAVKLLRPELQGPGFAARFARERRVLARLNHAGIARLYDAGTDAGQSYLVLEYVDGAAFAQHVAEHCPSVASRVLLVLRIAQAVEHAHAQLVVHRDLKPTNIVVTAEGVPKLLDFGVAALLDDRSADGDSALTRQLGRMLTLGYAAPEQITGSPSNVATDVYALGVILYELLSGRLPFAVAGRSRTAAEHAMLHEEPAALDVAGERRPGMPLDAGRAGGDLEAVLGKALRKDPAARYPSATALIDDLQRWLDHRPISVRAEQRRYRLRLWLRRNALATGLTAALVLALSSGLAIATWQWRRAEQAAVTSERATEFLTGMLGNANPDSYGGALPNELQLLKRSSDGLSERFANDPATLLRILDVLVRTYTALNRYDLAIPLAAQAVATAVARYGEDDPRTIDARLAFGRIYIPVGPPENVIAQYEPERDRVARHYGADSSTMGDLYHGLLLAYLQTGQLAPAAEALEAARRIMDRIEPADSFDRAFHHAYEAKLDVARGDLGKALATLRPTERYQHAPPPSRLRFAIVLRVTELDLRLRLGDYADVPAGLATLRREADRLLGDGNALSNSIDFVGLRYAVAIGDYRSAAGASRARASSVTSGLPPYAVEVMRARALAVQAASRAAAAATLGAELQASAAALRAVHAELGFLGGDAWVDLARAALLVGDLDQAEGAVRQLRGADAPRYAHNVWLASRIDQVEGDLARARGDLPRSAALLARRVRQFERGTDESVLQAWSAQLDLACTLATMRDPGAATALARAAALRPPRLPVGHPFDAVAAYLQRLTDDPRAADAGSAARGALEAVWQEATGRPGRLPAALGGLL